MSRSKSRKSKSRPQKAAAPASGPAAGAASPERQRYRQACQWAAQGRTQEARRLYEALAAEAVEPALQALVHNDLGTLAAVAGDLETARREYRQALALDAACLPARRNLELLQTDPAPLATAAPVAPKSKVPAASASPSSTKVAVVSFLFNWPSTGGGIVHTVELAQFLARAGYEVRHFYVRYAPWEIGIVERPLSFPSQALDFAEAEWNVPTIQKRLRQAVDAFGPDRVIITDSWNVKPLLAEALRGYPYILRLQAMEMLCPLNNVRLLSDSPDDFRQCPRHQLADPQGCRRCLDERGHFSGYLHQAERALSGVDTPAYYESLLRALREAEAVLVVNPLHEAMLSPYAKQVRVVTAGMDPARFPWPEPPRPPVGKTILLFAGLVQEPMKGFDVLHRACALLWQRRQDFELVATADPPGPIDPFTRFVGWQSQEDLPRRLREADVLVMPTVAQEALGRTAVEAMAAGRPVIASRLGGLPFTVGDGATGLLFEPGDAADLARKIEMLLDDPALRQRLGLAGRQRFEEHYAWEGIVERHYRPLLEVRNSRDGVRTAASDYRPFIPDRVDEGRLVEEAGRFFRLGRAEVEERLRSYRRFHEAKDYARTLGEYKTLCFEEAFLLSLALAAERPRTIVEIGTQHGKSTRRLIDLKNLLGLDGKIVCLDVADVVRHFAPAEAELMVENVTGRFAERVLRTYAPGLLFLDVHAYPLLREALVETLADPGRWLVALHDCGRGLCNPRMTLAKDDPNVSSSTGVWERHVLAEVFGVADPLSERLDDLETATRRLRIFSTPHGLAVILPQ